MHSSVSATLILLFAVALPAQADEEGNRSQPTKQRSQAQKLPKQLARFDKDGDGKISAAEMPANARARLLSRYDKNKDKVLDVSELRVFVAERRRQKGKSKKPARSEKPPTGETLAGRVRVIQDVPYTNGTTAADIPRKLDLYLPQGRKDFPILFWIHGGGLHAGDKSKASEVAQRFALEGFGVVAANYRLSPAVKFPAHIEDVAMAFRWIYDHLPKYGGDRERIFVTGGSAGGHLTILLTLDERYLKQHDLTSKNIRAALPISGLMDVSRAGPGRIGAVWDDDPATLKRALPLSYVRKNAPPILIMYADGESPERAKQNRTMFAAMQKLGHRNLEIKVLMDRTHNTIRPNLAKPDDPALQTMLAFMKKHGAKNVPIQIPSPLDRAQDRDRDQANPRNNQRRPISASKQGNRSASAKSSVRDEAIRPLPDIRTFVDTPSNRFLVDLDVVQSGHPYKGKNAKRPHTGGHVYFRVPENPIPATDVSRFPAIYAVADGVVTRIDYSFRLREIYVSATQRRVANTRYGIGLTFATSEGHAVDMHYSIEPFIDPGDDKFYDRFILVKVGQRVKKGDIIARMYIPPDRAVARNTHIHFNLLGGRKRTFQSPSIFVDRIVKRFHATWDNRRGTDDGKPIPPCMGYKLTPQENPFGSGPKDTL